MYRAPPCSTCHPVRLELEQLRAEVARLQAENAVLREQPVCEAPSQGCLWSSHGPYQTEGRQERRAARLAARVADRQEERQRERLVALGGLLAASAARVLVKNPRWSSDPSPGAAGGRLASAPPAPVSQRQGLCGGGLVFSTENATTPETGSP